MATIKERGKAINIVYPYVTREGETMQMWETYHSALEARQRKVKIDYLQEQKDYEGLLQAVIEYKALRNAERVTEDKKINTNIPDVNKLKERNNLDKTYLPLKQAASKLRQIIQLALSQIYYLHFFLFSIIYRICRSTFLLRQICYADTATIYQMTVSLSFHNNHRFYRGHYEYGPEWFCLR